MKHMVPLLCVPLLGEQGRAVAFSVEPLTSLSGWVCGPGEAVRGKCSQFLEGSRCLLNAESFCTVAPLGLGQAPARPLLCPDSL